MPQRLFGDRIFTLLLGCQIVLLALALALYAGGDPLLAPGFGDDPLRFSLAVELTRITFPYLLLMTLVTLYSASSIRSAASRPQAAAPILLNVTMVVTLATAVLFPTPGHAAAWGVLIAGVLEVLLVGGAALARRRDDRAAPAEARRRT
jgi:putative peptidoglycan lipid II flippase